MFYIGGLGFVCQIIEPVTFTLCAFIFALFIIIILLFCINFFLPICIVLFALRNIAFGGYLGTRRNIYDVRPATVG